MEITVRRLVESDIQVVVAFSLTAWAPVFASLESHLGADVFRMIYPDWASAQASAVETVCRQHDVGVAVADAQPVGFVALRVVDDGEVQAGEIYMIAVDPTYQGAGVGTALMHHALAQLRAKGLQLAVIGTGGDAGHAPARALYEKFGFSGLPQVRYYRTL